MRSYKSKILNSGFYDKYLKKRGQLDFWLDTSIFLNWYYEGKQVKGGNKIYSDAVIKLILILSSIYHLPLRQTEGFVSSILALQRVCLDILDYTTLSRRRKILDVSKKLNRWNRKENLVFAIDTSELKCCGEKE